MAECRWKLEGHKSSVTSLRRRGENQLLSGSEDGTGRVWDVERKRSLRCFVARQDQSDSEVEVSSVCSGTGDFQHLIGLAHDNKISLFDERDPALVNRKAAFTFNNVHFDDVNEIIMEGAVDRMIAGDDNGEIAVYDLRKPKLLRKVSPAHANICSSVCFRHGTPWQAVSAGLDGKVVHWNFNKIKQLFSYTTTTPSSQNRNQMVNPRYPYSLACQTSGNIVAAGLGDGNVVVLDLESKSCLHEFEAADNMISAAVWADFGDSPRILLSGGSDGYVTVTELSYQSSSRQPLDAFPAEMRESLQASMDSSSSSSIQRGQKCQSQNCCKLQCTSQVNTIASSPRGSIFVGDQGPAILVFDIHPI